MICDKIMTVDVRGEYYCGYQLSMVDPVRRQKPTLCPEQIKVFNSSIYCTKYNRLDTGTECMYISPTKRVVMCKLPRLTNIKSPEPPLRKTSIRTKPYCTDPNAKIDCMYQ